MTEVPDLKTIIEGAELADTRSISDLFAEDPLNLTIQDRSKIIQYYRDNRQKFLLGQKQEKLAKPSKTSAKTAGLDIELGDLEL